jgi:hypothetical protein
MKTNMFGLNNTVYAFLFVASVFASAATFGTVALGFEMHQRHVAETGWVMPARA